MKPLLAIALSAAALAALGGEPALRAADPRPEIVALEMAGDVSGALNELHAALRADPAQARRLGLLYLRGHLLERLGRLREAADAFAASIAGEPALAPYARLRIARLQDRHGHPEVPAGLAALLLAAAPPPGPVGPATEILAGALVGLVHLSDAPLIESFGGGDLARPRLQAAEQRPVLRRGLEQARDVLPRHDQDVGRSLRREIVEGDHLVVLMHDAGRYVAGHDAAEDAVAQGTTSGIGLGTSAPPSRSTSAPRVRSLRSIDS
jgi:hypothetical protein